MESNQALKIDERKKALLNWLEDQVGFQQVTLQPMVGDASFRRYFRINSYVVMDAPPPRENCKPFVAIAKALRQIGLQAPEIIQEDVSQGFLLLTDFGDQTYLKKLTSDNATVLYQSALNALFKMHLCQTVPFHALPYFTADFMRQEWQWHKDWFLNKYLTQSISLPDIDACYEMLIASAIEQPQVFMHRDYHAGNLMVLPNDVGILDFQDAFIGPLTYDVVSLLRDCYISWPKIQVNEWALYYFNLLQQGGELKEVSFNTFLRWFDLMGIQRHLKALMTFARKHVRDNESQYLAHIPRTLSYIIEVSKSYNELAPLHNYYKEINNLCAP